MHTPGPWTAWDDDGTGTLPCVLSKQTTSYGNFYVAQCNVFGDARLIAAAPELLEAARLAVIELGYVKNAEIESNSLPMLRAAIAKAKGEA